MTTPLFGFMTDVRESLAELANNLLLVAGGFLVGYLLGGLIGKALGKWVFRQKNAEGLQKFGRPVGGIIAAIIVALIVFTGKGKPKGDGGDGKGTPITTSTPGTNAPPKTDVKIPPTPDLKKPPELKQSDSVINVTVYGGSKVSGDRFYQLEDDTKNLMNLETLEDAIRKRKESAKGTVSVLIHYPSNKEEAPGNVGEGQLHPTVAKLVAWLKSEAKLTVSFPPDS